MLDIIYKENIWEDLLSKSYNYLFSMDVETIIDEVIVRAEILYGDKYRSLLNEKAMLEVIELLKLEDPIFPMVNNIMTKSFIELLDYEEEALTISMKLSEMDKHILHVNCNKYAEREPNVLSQTDIVRPLSVGALNFYYEHTLRANRHHRYVDSVSRNVMKFRSEFGDIVQCAPPMKPDGKVLVSIDLENSSNDEILSSIKSLLSVWRKELDISEVIKKPSQVKGNTTLNKIIDYKLIELMDLLILSNVVNETICHEKLQDSLYADSRYKDWGADKIKRTIIPLSKKFTDEIYVKTLKSSLSDDNKLYSIVASIYQPSSISTSR
ncbi:DUF6387 family protein [Aeromonas sp. XH]|uniref:DUF6387 family protein n=1 Tax=Aeromonas sp. XH TaxID=3081770 RepID=UPI002966F909|nr:DUF6387 family protein [Aeromonas sp. XH]WOX49057.1 DUF6387 family protein [Aeromonas sp. XH]